MEDKQKICDLLCATLQATRGYHDLIQYEDGFEEYVTAVFQKGGRRKMVVTADSGQAMIRDIMEKI
ncbi:MAG: hypothetical protein LUG61_08835 [Lachnospiraceae bacterium]|nr:hypothetical protein [Lachnospiraceae bacterium]